MEVRPARFEDVEEMVDLALWRKFELRKNYGLTNLIPTRERLVASLRERIDPAFSHPTISPSPYLVRVIDDNGKISGLFEGIADPRNLKFGWIHDFLIDPQQPQHQELAKSFLEEFERFTLSRRLTEIWAPYYDGSAEGRVLEQTGWNERKRKLDRTYGFVYKKYQ